MALEIYGGRQNNVLLHMEVGDVAFFSCNENMMRIRLRRATKRGRRFKWTECVNGGYAVERVRNLKES